MGHQVIAVVECAAGNESIGTEWIETAIFDEQATLKAVLDWKATLPSGAGRLMITRPKAEQSGSSQ